MFLISRPEVFFTNPSVPYPDILTILSCLSPYKIEISYSTDLIESESLSRNSSFNNFNANFYFGSDIRHIKYTFEVFPSPRELRI